METSAKTGENVEKSFIETASKIYQNIENGVLDPNSVESGIQFTSTLIEQQPTTNPSQSNCSC
jgi:GTPase SAR1 family protein